MNKLDSFAVEIRTGPRGRDTVPRVRINGRAFEFDKFDGGVEGGEVLVGSFDPHSHVQEFLLEGPDIGFWDIDQCTVEYHVSGREPYRVHLGAVTLDRNCDLNLLYDSPEDTFEV